MFTNVCEPFLGCGAAEALVMKRAEAERLLEHERDLAAVDAHLAVRGPGAVGRGLHELAEQRRADLLVVGSTRHALLGRVVMGDDCRAALDGAPCAIAVARADTRWHRIACGGSASALTPRRRASRP